jgi:hypothetical protein
VIDTVTIFRPFQRHSAAELPADWAHGTHHRSSHGRTQSRRYNDIFYFSDPVSGYRGYGERDQINYHRASLPRLIHGDNGHLIKNQAELDAALDLLCSKAGQLGTSCTTDSRFTRVDLVWQFKGDPAQFIQAHRVGRHPRIYSDPIRYEARSLALKGSELRISIYDKRLEQCGLNGDVVRVEVQLKGRLLREQLGDGDAVTHLDFNACYQAYRRILLGFIPAPIPIVSNIASFLARAEQEGWQSGGVPAFDLYTANMSDRNIRRLKQDMARVRAAVHKIDWAQLLPADGPPPVVELPATDDPDEPA